MSLIEHARGFMNGIRTPGADVGADEHTTGTAGGVDEHTGGIDDQSARAEKDTTDPTSHLSAVSCRPIQDVVPVAALIEEWETQPGHR